MKNTRHFWGAVLLINIILPVSANMPIFERSYKDGLLEGQRLALMTTQWDTVDRSSRRNELQIAYTCSRLASGMKQDVAPYRRLLKSIYHHQNETITKLDRRDDFYFSIGASQSHMADSAALHAVMEGITTAESMQLLSARVYASMCLPLLGMK